MGKVLWEGDLLRRETSLTQPEPEENTKIQNFARLQIFQTEMHYVRVTLLEVYR